MLHPTGKCLLFVSVGELVEYKPIVLARQTDADSEVPYLQVTINTETHASLSIIIFITRLDHG